MGPRHGMSHSERYAIDVETVVSETVDDEAIVVNLANGYYYSLDPIATLVWSAVQAGRSVAEMLADVRARYDCRAVDPESPLRAFLSALIAEGLIAADGSPAPSGSTDGAPAAGPSTAPVPVTAGAPASATPFRAPAFQRFTDMHAFLLVDPIHEVDDTGWPNLPPPGASAGRA
jgi:hypothetical protein